MKGRARSQLTGQEGAVAILMAILLVVLLAAVAMSVDAGGLYLRRRALVNGSDSAALAAARTCARINPGPAPFDTPESSADYEVQANAPITPTEVAGTNITATTPCGTQAGHVSVQYTSQQGLYFAPVLGFNRESPVTTTATASWGLGSNNPVPIVLSSLLGTGACPVPPNGAPAIGQTCSFWYDNDRLNGGNFAFLSLDPQGWDVPAGDNCSQSQSGGTSTLTQWINGIRPASVVLRYTDPTYVCTDTGIRGVGGKNGPNSQVWNALATLEGQSRDFPINWEGPGSPEPGAPSQGTIYQQGNIDKYDIIGFASLTIVDVLDTQEAAGSPPQNGTCSKNNTNANVLPGTYTWIEFGTALGCAANKLPPTLPVDSISGLSVDGLQQGTGYTFDTNGITLSSLVAKGSNVSFTWGINATNGPCGPVPPSNSSAMCVITTWHGSTLTGDYPEDQLDNIRIVRLCDLAYGTCLDQ